MRFIQRLMERNVANVEDIELVVQRLQERAHSPVAKLWIKQTIRKWLIKQYDRVQSVHTVPDNSPKWLVDAIERGDNVVSVILDGTLQQRLNHIVDYLNANPTIRLTYVSVEQAEKAARRWIQQLNKKASDIEDDIDTKVIYRFNNGYHIRQLLTQKAYQREGKLMNHCAASYWGSPSTVISLRDAQNKPHVTLEISNNTIVQMQAKGDTVVKAIYISLLTEFFKKSKLKLGNDLRDSEYFNIVLAYGVPAPGASIHVAANEVLQGKFEKILPYDKINDDIDYRTYDHLETILDMIYEDYFSFTTVSANTVKEKLPGMRILFETIERIKNINCKNNLVQIEANYLPFFSSIKKFNGARTIVLRIPPEMPASYSISNITFDCKKFELFMFANSVTVGSNINASEVIVSGTGFKQVKFTSSQPRIYNKITVPEVFADSHMVKFNNVFARKIQVGQRVAHGGLDGLMLPSTVLAHYLDHCEELIVGKQIQRYGIPNERRTWIRTLNYISLPKIINSLRQAVFIAKEISIPADASLYGNNVILITDKVTGKWLTIHVENDLTIGVKDERITFSLPEDTYVGGNLTVTSNVIVPDGIVVEGEIYVSNLNREGTEIDTKKAINIEKGTRK